MWPDKALLEGSWHHWSRKLWTHDMFTLEYSQFIPEQKTGADTSQGIHYGINTSLGWKNTSEHLSKPAGE